jgi:hypothetical protein
VQYPELNDGGYAKPLVPYDAILSPGGHDVNPRYFINEIEIGRRGSEVREWGGWKL